MAADDPIQSREGKLAARRSAEQDILLREVDDAVRQDQLGTAMRKNGIKIAVGALVLVAAFGGWLLWRDNRESTLETRSEALVTAYDEIAAGQVPGAAQKLAPVASEGGAAASASAGLALAAIDLRDNKREEAFRRYEAIAADEAAPAPYRDFARIRLVSIQFDQLPPQQVIDRLKPLATPGNAWFGSAGELVAMAYLRQGREDLAGPLLAAIARNEDVPQTLRTRTRQLAGMLGYDAIVDVEDTLEQLRQEQGAATPAPAAAPQAPPAP